MCAAGAAPLPAPLRHKRKKDRKAKRHNKREKNAHWKQDDKKGVWCIDVCACKTDVLTVVYAGCWSAGGSRRRKRGATSAPKGSGKGKRRKGKGGGNPLKDFGGAAKGRGKKR